MKETYICLESGEHHPALCVVEKHSEIVGHMNPTEIMKYVIHAVEALPAGMSRIDMREKVKTRMQKYKMGNIRFILGYTYIDEDTARFFERTNLKPVKITVTGGEKSYKEGFMQYVPYSEMLARIDELREQDALTFSDEVSESGFVEDDDCDLALGMAVWYAEKEK